MIGTGNVLNTWGIFTGKYIAAREPFIHRVGCLIKRLHWFFTQVDFIQLLVVAVACTDLHVFTEKIISGLKRETTTDKDTAWVLDKDNVDHRITQDIKLTNVVDGSQKLHTQCPCAAVRYRVAFAGIKFAFGSSHPDQRTPYLRAKSLMYFIGFR